MKPRKHPKKLPAIRSRRLKRKGNLPSNPYIGERATASRLEDKPGYPSNTRPVDLSDEAQLNPSGQLASPRRALSTLDVEPMFTLLASDPFAAAFVLCWAKIQALVPGSEARAKLAAETAVAMEEWRRRNSISG